MNEKFKSEAQSQYRPMAFWSLNGELKESELFRQLLEFKMGGFGGVFLHARGNLKTPYMSNIWMDRMHYCMKTAQELGLEAWIYDEMNWPSGRAEGAVESLGGKNISKKLSLVPADIFPIPGEIARTSDGTEAFCVGFGHITDQLSKRTTQDFIQIVHERYKKDCGEFFGNSCPGVFFDEPQYASAYDKNDYVPWSDDLLPLYFELWGEDLLPELASLFRDEGDFRTVRKQFWFTVAELYSRSWGKPLFDWCAQNGLKLTGHYEWEDDLKNIIRCTADVMRHYEYEHIPGTDQLGLGLYAPWIHLRCSSVSQQLGRERTMCECFGVSGQGVTISDRRWMYGQLLSRGVDMFVPHISHYSLAESNKRDCPPYNQYQQPWWYYGKTVEDGVAKACRLLASGHDRVHICVLDPIVTAWCSYVPGNTAPAEALQTLSEKLYYELANKGIFFHYIGESYFRDYAAVEDGKFCVGKMKYDTVILPGVTDVMDLSRELLEKFVASGGRLFAVEKPWPGAETLSVEALAEILAQENEFEISAPCWFKYFDIDGIAFGLAANPSREKPVEISSLLPRNIKFTDLITGKEVVLAPGETFCLAPGAFVVTEETDEAPNPPTQADFADQLEISGNWLLDSTVQLRHEKNCVNLDRCSLRIESGDWSAPGYSADIRDLAAAEKSHRRTSEWQTSTGDTTGISADNIRTTLRYTFRAENLNSEAKKSFRVAFEAGELCSAFLNGKPLTRRDGIFLDSAFLCFDGSEAVSDGENEILICSVSGRRTPTIEDVYLIGNFSCFVENTNERVLRPLSAFSKQTDGFELRGYPFFAGELKLKNSFELPYGVERAELEILDPHMAAAAIIVNGKAAEPLMGAPWKRDISDLVLPGENTIEIRVVNTLRNLLGPLHLTHGEERSIGPADYNNKKYWSEAPIFSPLGFGAAVVKF